MSACIDPTKPWLGIDFLTWRPPPRPVLECNACGWVSDTWGVMLLPVFRTSDAVVVCSGCWRRPGKDIRACFEVSMALQLGTLT